MTSPFSPEEALNPAACDGCGLCAEVCPTLAVRMRRDGVPDFDSPACIGCAHCAAHCPANAFGMDRAAPDPCGPAELDGILRMRRSVRVFSRRQPSEETLRELCDSVLPYSPTGTNSCGLDVRLVGRPVLEEMVRRARRPARALAALRLLRPLAGLLGMADAARRFAAGEDLIFRGAPAAAFVFSRRGSSTGREDGVIAATLLSLRARTMGLGTLWNGVALWLYRLMPGWRLPNAGGRRLSAVMCIGYPALTPRWEVPPRPYRLRLHRLGRDG